MKSDADIEAYLRDSACYRAYQLAIAIGKYAERAKGAGFNTMQALFIASLACQETLFISHTLLPGNMDEHKKYFQELGQFLLSEANRISENEKIHKHAQTARNQILTLDAGKFGDASSDN